jgi:TRAP-type C4-dicarboxylate transport system permease small subunit
VSSSFSEVPTETLQTQYATLRTLLLVIAAIFVLGLATLAWLVASRGWQSHYIATAVPMLSLIAVSAPIFGRMSGARMELERRGLTL